MTTSTRITALPAATAVTADDLFVIVDDPAGTPVSKKIAASAAAISMAQLASTVLQGTTNINQASEYLTIVNSGPASSVHLTSASGFSATYIIGIGKDVAGVGLQCSNKADGAGAVFTQTSTVPNNLSPALFVAQQNTVAPAAFFHQQVAGAALALEVGVTVGTATVGQKMMRWFTLGNHLSGDVSAYDGTLRWIDPVLLETTVTLQNQTGAGSPAILTLVGSTAASAQVIIEMSAQPSAEHEGSLRFFRPTGGGTYYPSRIATSTTVLAFQTSAVAAKGSESWNTQLSISASGLGFYATTPSGKPTVTGSRGANAALASLLTALSTLGLLTDSSS